jgi:hypothetical protein
MAIFDLCPRSWPFANISSSQKVQKVLILSSPITIQKGHVLLDPSAKCPDDVLITLHYYGKFSQFQCVFNNYERFGGLGV